MAIDKEKVWELVEIFYRSPFKIFYINHNGTSFERPDRVFVSLSMTTSMSGLEVLREFIEEASNYKATIVEISSKKIGGQFINTVINTCPSKQYLAENLPEGILCKQEAESLLSSMLDKLDIEDLSIVSELGPMVNHLKKLIDKFNDQGLWDTQYICEESPGVFKPYMKYINYRKSSDGIEYRLGILVEEQ